MNVTTPHSLPDGVSSSAGMNASTAADKNASGAVSVRYASARSPLPARPRAWPAPAPAPPASGSRRPRCLRPPESCDVESD